MALKNTHRAAGRAVTPISPSLALKGAGGAVAIGTVAIGSFASAQAAPAAPQAITAAPSEAPAVAPQANTAPVGSMVLSPVVNVTTGKTVARGSSGARVASVQSALNDNGANLAVDGIFGPRTHRAVVNFQAENGLRVDGIVGPQTRGALNLGGGGSEQSTGNGGGSNGSTARSADSGSSSSQGSIVSTARSLTGTPYVSRGSSPSGFDCSGFTQYVYAQNGISIPRTSSQQANSGRHISQSQAQPGDLVVWPGHVGIYAGNGQVIDAGTSPHAVTERGIWGSPSFVTYR